MRPSSYLFMLVATLLLINFFLFRCWRLSGVDHAKRVERQQQIVAALGLTDICVATEARYTRHPAISDPVSPFMDHPGAVEHFPSGSFWRPVVQSTISSSLNNENKSVSTTM